MAGLTDLAGLDAGYGAGAGNYLDTTADTSVTDTLNSLDSKKREKLNTLNASKDKKLGIPEGYVKGVIRAVDDADTLMIEGGPELRLGDKLLRYDAAETEHEATRQMPDWAPDWTETVADWINPDQSKSAYAQKKQREQVGHLLGKLPETVTDEDIHSVGNYQTVQMLADLTRKEGEERWTPTYSGDSSRINLKDIAGDGIEVYYDPNGKRDEYGRLITDIYNPHTGENVVRTHALDPRLNAFAYDPNRKEEATTGERALNIGKGAVSGGLQLLGGIADASTSLGASMLEKAAKAIDKPNWYSEKDANIAKRFFDKYKSSEWANAVTGYEPAYADALLDTALDSFKKGDYIKGIWAGAKAGPEVFMQSLAYMAAVSNIPGAAVVIGSEVNTSIDEFKKNNDRDPEADEIARMALVDTAKVLLERIPFLKAIEGKSAITNTLKKLTDSVPDNMKSTIGKEIAKKAGVVAMNVGEEAGQEGVQYLMDYYNREYGTKADKGLNLDEMYKAMIGGGAAGGFAGSVGAVKQAVTPSAKEQKQYGKEDLDKAATQLEAYRATLDKYEDGKTIETDEMFGEYEAGKTYTKEDIVDTVRDMALNPTAYEDTPAKDAFIQNNLQVFKEIIDGTSTVIKAKRQQLDEEPVEMAEEPTKETAEDINRKTAHMQYLTEVLSGQKDVETTSDSIAAIEADTGVTGIADALKDMQTTKSDEAKTKLMEVHRKLSGAKVEVKTADATPTQKLAAERIAARLGAGVEAVDWKTSKQAQIDTVVSDNVTTKEAVAKKSKRLNPLSDKELWDVGIKGDLSAVESKRDVDSKLESDVFKRLAWENEDSEKVRSVLTDVSSKLKDRDIPLTEGMDAAEKEQSLFRLVAAAINQVQSSVVSARHEALNENALEIPKGAAAYKLAAQIGKDYVNSYGLQITGSPVERAKAYTDIGMQALKLASDVGVIKEFEDFVYNTGLVKGAKDSKTTAKQLGLQSKIDVGTGKEVVYGKVYAMADAKDGDSEIASAFKLLKPLMSAGNVELPGKEALSDDYEVQTDKPNGASKAQVEAVKGLVNKPLKVKDGAVKTLLDSVVKDYRKAIANGFTISQWLRNREDVATILGLQPEREGFLKESISGANWAKKQNLRDILDNWEYLRDGDLFFEYKIDVNERISLVNNILNFQHDKVIARNIITPTVKSKITKKNLKYAVNEIADEFKGLGKADGKKATAQKRINAILNAGVNKNLDRALKAVFGNENAVLANLASELKNSKSPVYGMSGFKALSLLQVVKDIREGDIEKGIETDYAFGADASASGVMNTLINVMGLSETKEELNTIREILRSFGVYFGGKKPKEYKDPYLVIMDSLLSATSRASDVVKEQVAKLNAIGIDIRDLAKQPVMTWFYGSKKIAENAGKDTALRVYKIAVGMTEGNKKEAIKELRSISGLENVNPNNMTKEQYEIAAKHYADKLGAAIEITLEDTFPQVVKYRQLMTSKTAVKGQMSVFSMLTRFFKDSWKNGAFPGAVTPLLTGGEKQKGHEMSVQKRKHELLQEADEENELPLIAYWAMDNRTSLAVNNQHSEDAALLLNSVVGAKNGMLTVHDYAAGTIQDLMGNIEQYNDDYLKLPKMYNFLEQSYELLESLGKSTELSADMRAQFDKQMKKLKATIETANAQRDEVLVDGTKAEIYGLKEDQVAELDNEIVVDAQKESTETVEDDTTATAVAQDTDNIEMAMDELFGAKDSTFEQFKKALKSKKSFKAVKDMLLKVAENKDYGLDEEHAAMLKDALAKYSKGSLPNIDFSDRFEWVSGEVATIKVNVSNTEDVVDGRQVVTTNRFVELLLHEIEHDLTANYVLSNAGRNSGEFKYVRRVLDKLSNAIITVPISDETRDRLNYIVQHKDVAVQVAELVSVLRAEPEFAAEISNIIHGKEEKSFVAKLLAVIKGLAIKAVKAFTGNEEITFENTAAVLNAFREKNVDAAPVDGTLGAGVKRVLEKSAVGLLNEATAGAIGKVFTSSVHVIGPLAKRAHSELKKVSTYRGVVNLIKRGLWDSKFADKMKVSLGLDATVPDKVLRELLALGSNIEQTSAKLLTEDLPQLRAGVNAVYKTKKEQKLVNRLFAKTGIAYLLVDAKAEALLLDGTPMADKLKKFKPTKIQEERANQLVKFYTEGVLTGGMHANSAGMIFLGANGLTELEFNQYVALKAIDKIGGLETIEKMAKEHKGLYDALKETALQVKATGEKVSGLAEDKIAVGDTDFEGHFTLDVTDEPYEYKLVKPGLAGEVEHAGDVWKKVDTGMKNGYDLYMRKLDVGYTTRGIGISQNRFTNGQKLKTAWVDAQIANDPDFLKNNNISVSWVNGKKRYKLNLTEKVKEENLALVEDVAESMFRTLVHNKELIEMETLKDVIRKKAVMTVNSKNINGLIADIRKRKLGKPVKRAIPMFIKFDVDELGSDFEVPKIIKDFYGKPRANVSRFNNFHRSFDMIRNDMQHVLLDVKTKAIFPEGSTGRKIEKTYRHIVSALKLHLIANPAKLLGDAVANSVLLADVPLEAITKYGKEYPEEMEKLTELRNKQIELELKELSAPGKYKQQIEDVRERIKKSKMYPALKHGFLQSLSTGMVMKDFESIRGLQQDVDTVLKGLLYKNEKERTWVGEIVSKFSKTGLQGEDALRFISKIASAKSKLVGDELEAMAKRLEKMKDDEDLVRYVGEFLGTPSSELVRQSSNTMVNVDGISRWIMYNHLKDTGMKEDEAAKITLDTFVDYRVNLPEEIKMLSDLGIMLFPNFWMKYQKVLFKLVKDSPVTGTSGYLFDELMGIGGAHPLDTNILNKLSDGTVIGVVDPTDSKIYNAYWWLF